MVIHTARFQPLSDRSTRVPVMPYPGALAAYTGCHFITDAVCFFYLFGPLRQYLLSTDVAALFPAVCLLYNGFAFALQWVWGLIADRFPRWPIGLAGLIATGAAFEPLLARSVWRISTPAALGFYLYLLIPIGCGNAAFHVEGGRDSLIHSDGTEKRTGVFAMGGAAGVMIGAAVGKAFTINPRWALLPLTLWLAAVALAALLKWAGSPKRICLPAEPLPALATARAQHMAVGLASVFLIFQVLAMPSLNSIPRLRHLPSVFARPFAVLLFIALCAARFIGGWLTAAGLPFQIGLACAALITGTTALIFPSPLTVLTAALSVGGLSAWTGWQFYRLLPRRPALAYALQKIPLFAAAALLTWFAYL